MHKMDSATRQADLDLSPFSRRTAQTAPTEVKSATEDNNTTKVNLIHQMFSECYDYASIEQCLNKHHAPVGSPVRQELWLTFNREHLSEVLRRHHSQVLDRVGSDPATYNCPNLLLTDNNCTEMQHQMTRRLEEVKQSFQSSSNVKWGAKLQNHAKWEYLKDEIVLLYRWLKQQNTHGRGMNTVRAEMSRRYGELFEFRDTTYFTKLSDWGESSSRHGGSSWYPTPRSQPDTPCQPTTPFDNNAVSEYDTWSPELPGIPENDNWAPEIPNIGQAFYPAPLLIHNKPSILPPEPPLTNRNLPLRTSIQFPNSPKLDSSEEIDSDQESQDSYCSIATVSTIVSEIRNAIDEVMIDYEEPEPPCSGPEGQPNFDNWIDWDASCNTKNEDIEMQEGGDHTGTVCHTTSIHEAQYDARESFYHASMQKAQDNAGNIHQIDSGYADNEPTTISEATQVVLSTELALGLASNHKPRSGTSRPKNVAGGPTALVEVALQTSTRSQQLAKGFGKSAENLKMFSKIQEIQRQNNPLLHPTSTSHYTPTSHHSSDLHHLAAIIYDRDFDSMKPLTETLLQQCPNVMIRDTDGNTAGHILLATPRQIYRPEYPTLWWMKKWLDSGIGGITCRNHKGETLLHYAAKNGYKSVVTELLHRGADPKSRNNAGQSVIEVCDDALQGAIIRVTTSADSTSDCETRAGESARIADCAQLLRFHLG